MSSQPALDADQIAALFTRDGDYLAARWGRPVAPVSSAWRTRAWIFFAAR